jgi:hypothetical protein
LLSGHPFGFQDKRVFKRQKKGILVQIGFIRWTSRTLVGLAQILAHGTGFPSRNVKKHRETPTDATDKDSLHPLERHGKVLAALAILYRKSIAKKTVTVKQGKNLDWLS